MIFHILFPRRSSNTKCANVDLNQRYAKDSNRAGTESDYGRQLSIGRVPPADQVLYQTERYHTNTFGYDIPVREDGWYLLVLKFSEVYFGAPNMKVCNILCYATLILVYKGQLEKLSRDVPIKYSPISSDCPIGVPLKYSKVNSI